MYSIVNLVHLTKLEISSQIFDLDDFEDRRLKPLQSLIHLKINDFLLCGTLSIGATFCRIFSQLYPNLEELELKDNAENFRGRFYEQGYTFWQYDGYVRNSKEIKPHLGQFAKLRNCKLNFFYE